MAFVCVSRCCCFPALTSSVAALHMKFSFVVCDSIAALYEILEDDGCLKQQQDNVDTISSFLLRRCPAEIVLPVDALCQLYRDRMEPMDASYPLFNITLGIFANTTTPDLYKVLQVIVGKLESQLLLCAAECTEIAPMSCTVLTYQSGSPEYGAMVSSIIELVMRLVGLQHRLSVGPSQLLSRTWGLA